ncbi:fructokinase [Azospirillum lipoferum]|uniref:ROK family protein n=1 Tax=Azospirillum lipoferum TaxID=193 RepID=A0A5A9GB43_AZOLI|nr:MULTISPECIES: ROK family protein [Azospirillum]KAA0591710.1 ROK family protein [Azospirillum lipoferum]MCP1614901.1 fructokinase [Azospirillum lipoferum]MDW5536348.1 ROK family protein [Azospirillum sp. NL1]
MRIGIDLGGTKIAAVALGRDGTELARNRRPTPRGYEATLDALAETVAALDPAGAGGIGISLPGVVDVAAGRVHAVNLPWLEGHSFAADATRRIGRPVRIANDANCFTLSEATDGAAAGGGSVVFGVILGTGVGGGIVVDGRILPGANGLAGEWGHAPLPWREGADGPPVPCGCGKTGCLETMLCGAGLSRLHRHLGGETLDPPEIAARALAGDAAAARTLAHHADALARALAPVVNLLDPDMVVVGGGLSALPGLCEAVTRRWGAWTLTTEPRTRMAVARHGAESGMRGAARLWPD